MQTGKDQVGWEEASPLVTAALGGWCALADMLEGYRANIDARATGSSDGTGTPAQDGGPTSVLSQNPALLKFMTQACLVFATSSARYWSRAARTYAEYYPDLYRLVTAAASRSSSEPEEQRIFLDRLRALLRELAELPGQESRWMQAELAKLEGQMFSGSSGQTGDYARRWKYKT